MDDMQAVYDEEVNGGSFGLMSLMRGTGDMVLGEDIMNNLPALLRAFEGTNLGTQEGLSEISRPMETEGFALELSTTPGLESMVGPEIGLALGALGGGGKGKTFKELVEEIQQLGGKMASDKKIDASRYADETDLPDFLKSFSQKQKESRLHEDMYTNRPSRSIDQGLGSLDEAKNIKQPSVVFDELEDSMSGRGPIGMAKNTGPEIPRMSKRDSYDALPEKEKLRVNALDSQRQKLMSELFGADRERMSTANEAKAMERLEELDKLLSPYIDTGSFFANGGSVGKYASGGRPGLYANINAKRKRIAAGSGERMRKKGDKGAPTAANFRESAKTAKKANGGGLSYMNGYYGKSYK